MDSLLQILLLLNVFLIGIGVAVGARYAWAHFHPHPDVKHARDAEKAVRLSAQTREQLVKEAEATYKNVLDTTTKQLVGDLSHTAERLNKDLAALGDKIINDELERFKIKLEEVHAVTAAASTKGVEDITAFQNEQKEKMLAEIEQEKLQLLSQIDTKLADSVVAFLVETLQHDVDLGAQTSYLTKVLDDHKNDFSGSVKNEA